MYVCVFITRFPLKGVLQVNGVRARAPKWLQFWDRPLSHRGPFPMEIMFYVSICKHILYNYIYTYIYTHIYICMWVDLSNPFPPKSGISSDGPWSGRNQLMRLRLTNARRLGVPQPCSQHSFGFFCFWPNSVWRGQTIKFPPYSDIFGHAGHWRDQEDGSLRCEASSSLLSQTVVW